MKSPDRDAADLVTRLQNANALHDVLTPLCREAASELVTLRRRAEQMDALIYWLQVDVTLLDDTTGEQLEREAIERHKARETAALLSPPTRKE